MTKTDNEKYVKRGADMFIEYNPEWEDEVSHANKGKVGAPYRYSETLIMLVAALMVGLGVQYRQLEGTIGRMIGESKTPSFSQLRKRMGRLDVSTDQGGVITVSDPKHPRILAGRRDRAQTAQQGRVDGQKVEGETRFRKAARDGRHADHEDSRPVGHRRVGGRRDRVPLAAGPEHGCNWGE